MAGRYGSLSRSLLSTATKTSTFRRSQPVLFQRLPSRRFLSGNLPRSNRILGSTQSLLPLHAAARLTSPALVAARCNCKLSPAAFFCRNCPDR
ncbi:hypothetical protein DM860_004976 [Cuscuta australis]|uniref:Uncharacterized protein n=1 Tax=Cuscuta australis TaxID=267555 RepID=A0A328DM06_9ASTE|nr:hypothetical protein DM860_004976 [Cuscuta australis]